MIAVLDACVLYPTVLRQILLGCAEQGLCAPLWSERLLEEWRRAARRNGGDADAAIAEAEIARANARFPQAMTEPGDETPLWLPDPADVHVLATAIVGKADTIITLNLRDFPVREVSGHNVMARPPDAILMDMWLDAPEAVEQVVATIHAEAERLLGETLALRGLLKRARLPRLGKALAR